MIGNHERVRLVVTTWGAFRVVAIADYGAWQSCSTLAEGSDLSSVLLQAVLAAGQPLALDIKPVSAGEP